MLGATSESRELQFSRKRTLNMRQIQTNFKYRVINHNENWLGTFLDKLWINKEMCAKRPVDRAMLPCMH